jgi:hypothetical protein
MVDKATKEAQRQNNLLAITGGAVEIPKCTFHLASYKFAASGAPVLDPLTGTVSGGCPEINIQPAFGESESQSLEYLQPSTARRTLGCTALGTIAEWVSYPPSSRSYCSCSPSGRPLHNKFERVSCFGKWKYHHRTLIHHHVAKGS